MNGARAAAEAFLFAFPALFSIVNPIAGAFFFNEVTEGRSHDERLFLARRIGLYAALVMLAALWVGADVLRFFGISIAALRIAGGVVIAGSGWGMLAAPGAREDVKQQQAAPATGAADVAFFPLTMPLTTGPGTISVAVALSAARPPAQPFAFLAGVSGAAAAMAVLIWLAYRSADRLGALLSASARRSFARMTAFLLLCVGVQIMISGIDDVLRPLLAGH